jgi:hypothetical protein
MSRSRKTPLGLCLLLACGDDSPKMMDAAVRGAASGEDEVEDAGPFAPKVELGKHRVELRETRQVVPGDGLPPEAMTGVANNNLDVIRHDGRVYLAWRSAPDHFAGSQAKIVVVSSEDEERWRFETKVALDADVREPRFLELGDSLFLYVSRLGTTRTSFEPMGVQVTERRLDGSWSELADIGLPGYVTWRTKTENGTPYMTAYLGGEHIYQFDGLPLQVDLLTTDDGRSWRPVDPEHRTIYDGGGSEADFAILGSSMYGVIRNEAGDSTGFGSLVCHAGATSPAALARWSCQHDSRKYDSPLMFALGGEAYLFGRRNVSDSGAYDVSTADTLQQQSIENQLDNWQRPKRCSLWRYVQGQDRMAFILDLPSRGDTCYVGLLRADRADEIIVYDYSSPLDGDDVAWMIGQSGNTNIYRHVLRFVAR